MIIDVVGVPKKLSSLKIDVFFSSESYSTTSLSYYNSSVLFPTRPYLPETSFKLTILLSTI